MKKGIKGKVIFLIVIIISFVLTIVSLALVEETPIPFIFSLLIYFVSGMTATAMYTPLLHFFEQGIPKGSEGCGCLLAPLLVFILPLSVIVFCIVGPIALIREIIKESKDQ